MRHTYYADPDFSNRLYKVLIDSDVPVKQFADSIGVSKNTIYRYLQGMGEPPMRTVKKICEEYNVSSDWLVGLKGD